MDFVSIFFLLGSFTLIRLCWSDWKTRLVKTDLSYYMMGVSSLIFLATGLIWVWVVFTLITTFGLVFLKKVKWLTNHIAAGDITILSWVMPSLLVLNVNYFIVWLFFYCIGNILMTILSKHKEMAGVLPMFVAFLITWLLTVIKII